MTDTFLQGADQSTAQGGQEGQGTNFATAGQGDNPGSASQAVTPLISEADLTALKKRDEHAQTHISTLEEEAKAYKAELEAAKVKLDQAAAVEDLLKDKGQEASAYDVEAIASKAVERVTAKLQAESQHKVAETNFNTVSEALTQKFGDKADEAVKNACAENGMDFDEMVTLAKKNPKLAMKLCDVKVEVEAVASKGTINTSAAAFQGHQSQSNIPQKHLVDVRTDRERVDILNARLTAHCKKLGINT
jgi:hypothetical protein